MKRVYIIIILLLGVGISCDNEDTDFVLSDDVTVTDDDGMEEMEEEEEEEEETPPDTDLSYFSLVEGDFWAYLVTEEGVEDLEDNLSVTGTADINGEVFTTFTASPEPAFGNMTQLFSAGAVREENATLYYTGSLTIPLSETDVFMIDIPEVRLYQENFDIGNRLALDEFTQVIEQDINGIPIATTVVFSTGSTSEDMVYTVGEFTFDTVIYSDITVNLTITASIFGAQITLLETQDVLTITNTFAENIGLIDSESLLDYEFVDLSPFGIELPFPPTDTRLARQAITSYEVAGDD